MIEEIRIKDFAIIDRLTLTLTKGFNVITGETGAGKSIIVDALAVLLKEKVIPADFVRHGSSDATVEVIISGIKSQIENSEEDILILRKILSLQGKNRCYINDSAYTLQGFAKFVASYINIHGQHEHTALLKTENHLNFFDSLAGVGEDVKKMEKLYGNYQNLKSETERLREDLKERRKRIDFLKFQIEEIEKANLEEDEEAVLSEKRQILRNILKLRELAEKSFSLLEEDRNSVYSNLSKVIGQIREISKFDSQAYEIEGMLQSAIAQIEEASYLLRKIKSSYEPDPHLLEKVEERLTLINKLKTKYGNSIKEIIDFGLKAKEELDGINISEESLSQKEKDLAFLEREVFDFAMELSSKRKLKKREIEERIMNELKFLGFSKPVFEVKISETAISRLGLDSVEFYFSANPGQPPKPLSKIASGGELSRLMLALKCVELSMGETMGSSMTLVFDEIDAGIGGKIAENVGRRLKEVSKHYQVLCVTHLPQIAALADNHIFVEKRIVDAKTKVEIRTLNTQERKEEIARMLSGRVTESSLEHAEELLKQSTIKNSP